MHRLLRRTKHDKEEETVKVQDQECIQPHTNTMSLRRIKNFGKGSSFIIMVILCVAFFNVFYVLFYGLPEDATTTVATTRKRETTIIRPTSIWTPPPTQSKSSFYHLVKDARYKYEFRYELNAANPKETQRLMILLNGSSRTCADYWQFAVGRRILATLRQFGFLILTICSERKKFDAEGPAQNNLDVRWMHMSLQKWMKEVYYPQFQQYPRLYIHGVSRGSKFAALLGRFLPIYGQIFTIYPGHWQGMLARSDHHVEMQARLILDPVFASWFYFDFCYDIKPNKTKNTELCPFQSNRNYYQPVAPTYFIHSKNDPFFKESAYTDLIKQMRKDAFNLGGVVYNHTDALKIHVLPPSKATPSYMQENFDTWNLKPYASRFFYEHFIAPKSHVPFNRTRRTCLCMNIDYKYYEVFPNITATWPKKKQAEYISYARDVRVFEKSFCEDICGDLIAHHAISSRDLDKGLNWISEMDQFRHSLQIKDYDTRPLRVWMYEKSSLVTKANYISSPLPNWINIGMSYQMYSPEFYLQDYFERLKASSTVSHHNLQWVGNPLLADYFIIPNDLMFHYSFAQAATMSDLQFKNLRDKLNNEYLEPLLGNVLKNFPYWTMSKTPNQRGCNHIIAILDGMNMGFLNAKTQNILKNVIQLVFTGSRQDLLPPNAPLSRAHGDMTIVYRHRYDVVIPQFTRLKSSVSILTNLNKILEKKKRLLCFAGTVAHSKTSQPARPLVSSMLNNINKKQKYNMTTQIQGKTYDTIKIIENDIKPNEYIEAVQASFFSLCPEDFLPWSLRIYEAIQIGSIPIILADNIVLPFERFIDWQSFSVKINVSNTGKITNFVHGINNFEYYINQKLKSALPHLNAFRWPYSAIGENGETKHAFLQNEDMDGAANNVFHYISLELRCRRLEQLYGLTSESFSVESLHVQQQTCNQHPTICPCHNAARRPLAFQEYV